MWVYSYALCAQQWPQQKAESVLFLFSLFRFDNFGNFCVGAFNVVRCIVCCSQALKLMAIHT